MNRRHRWRRARPGAAPTSPSTRALFPACASRNIGPAFISGRVSQIAVFPDDSNHYLVAEASGGILLTYNNGTTWTPVFDNYGSYSIGTIAIDPKNPSIVWVGTGENNNQRSVSYGDGVYKSEDAGRTWRNVGLKLTEHIARIVVDPRDSNVVYVAAPGPLWKGGGERGLYKTTDGGKTWSASLIKVGEYTGCSDVVMDPSNPDVLLAATHQRQRRYFGMIHGGPESALWRSIDAGKTWTKVSGGFPTGDLGRIGLNYAPSNPNMIYAQVEGARGPRRPLPLHRQRRHLGEAQQLRRAGPVLRQGAGGPGQFRPRLHHGHEHHGVRRWRPHPHRRCRTRNKHVDNHEIWVDPKNNNHYLVGCDGGVYESFDRAATWIFKANLPTAQLYDVAVSEDAPFYHVYGGTQDNNSFGCAGAHQEHVASTNADCFVTNGGDGFYSRVDPKDPNTIYANMQNGGMVRFDRRTGERVSIQPQPAKGDPPMRWNWDAPLIISPHSNTRLYFGAQRLYRSDDRGDSWRAVSPDLTRQLDRNKLPLMGKVWPIDAIQKNVSTALYDNISAIAESPKQEGLIYVGTDDGLVQVTEDGGKNWRKVDKPAGVPEDAYVQRILASQHDAGTVYVAYENHQNGDFKPYLLKSTDKGKTWVNIAGNLPERGGVYAIAEDHVESQAAVRRHRVRPLLHEHRRREVDQAQRRAADHHGARPGHPEADGRPGDRHVRPQHLRARRLQPAARGHARRCCRRTAPSSPSKTALSYLPVQSAAAISGTALFHRAQPAGGRGDHFQPEGGHPHQARRSGSSASAPPSQRGETPPYPTPEELRAEAEEEAPAIVVSIADSRAKSIRRMDAPATRGIHRVTWDLRAQSAAWRRRSPLGGGARGGGGRGGAAVAAARWAGWRRSGWRAVTKAMMAMIRRPRRRRRSPGRARQVHRRAGQTPGRRGHAAARLAERSKWWPKVRPPGKTAQPWRISRRSSASCRRP